MGAEEALFGKSVLICARHYYLKLGFSLGFSLRFQMSHMLSERQASGHACVRVSERALFFFKCACACVRVRARTYTQDLGIDVAMRAGLGLSRKEAFGVWSFFHDLRRHVL